MSALRDIYATLKGVRISEKSDVNLFRAETASV